MARSIGLLLLWAAMTEAAMPLPFTQEWRLTSPAENGTQVMILQNLLANCHFAVPITSSYDQATAFAVQKFQTAYQLSASGVLDESTASLVLQHCLADGYKDDGQPANALGYKYKVYVPVHRNRSIESTAILYAGNGTALYNFTVRAHGHSIDNPSYWPNFNNTGPGLNQFSPDGNTPTGLMTFDLNSPETIPKLYGPYPINRMVQGLKGNAAFLVPHVRDGLLLHTGEWPNWSPPQPMPNSAGCIHAYPETIYTIWQLLIAEGVKVRQNPFGVLPYPYQPQGLISIELID